MLYYRLRKQRVVFKSLLRGRIEDFLINLSMCNELCTNLYLIERF